MLNECGKETAWRRFDPWRANAASEAGSERIGECCNSSPGPIADGAGLLTYFSY